MRPSFDIDLSSGRASVRDRGPPYGIPRLRSHRGAWDRFTMRARSGFALRTWEPIGQPLPFGSSAKSSAQPGKSGSPSRRKPTRRSNSVGEIGFVRRHLVDQPLALDVLPHYPQCTEGAVVADPPALLAEARHVIASQDAEIAGLPEYELAHLSDTVRVLPISNTLDGGLMYGVGEAERLDRVGSRLGPTTTTEASRSTASPASGSISSCLHLACVHDGVALPHEERKVKAVALGCQKGSSQFSGAFWATSLTWVTGPGPCRNSSGKLASSARDRPRAQSPAYVSPIATRTASPFSGSVVLDGVERHVVWLTRIEPAAQEPAGVCDVGHLAEEQREIAASTARTHQNEPLGVSDVGWCHPAHQPRPRRSWICATVTSA